MKRNQLTDTKALDIKGLKDQAKKLRSDVADLILDKNMNTLKDLKSIAKKRKDLSQVLTILRQKELLAMFDQKGEEK